MSEYLPSRRAFIAGLGATLASPALGRASPLGHLSGSAFGTHWRLSSPDGPALRELRPPLEALFHEIDREMSPWRIDSDLSRFNASTSGVPASAELVRVTRAALAVARDSQGTFDPTVGPLVARWGFGPIHDGAAPNWRGLSASAGHLAKRSPGLTLDLCGIAKGRALDRAVELARDRGMAFALFDLGGELRALGRHPEGRDWRVAVEQHSPIQDAPIVLHLPADMAVATSGLDAQSYGLNGRRWGHIMDSTAGNPVDGKLRSVTVLAEDAMTADAWATALFAAGDETGPQLARDQGIAALFLFEQGRRIETGRIGAVLT
ncbi:FAD:protein FMN transferase [Marivita sp. XM-24bin2]|jgi:thiamine biosynthesis lipoprotein|uniref:FAD:protein FMN transferase n=1 Tax=unclassified Marivita TaxID=2632480 RepID=UPI000D795D10|nr:FAD:protein FMN transferase [Marivita sp. XM-24bin2]MCR9110676.1 FAD:protein FMN transferase [Paracoccaceae bacterium]PWL33772.1 MAG: FAD:protein FMN transferase [Marivita sp. XM-24bin2]